MGLSGTAVLFCSSSGVEKKYIRTENFDALLGNLKSSLYFYFYMSVKEVGLLHANNPSTWDLGTREL